MERSSVPAVWFAHGQLPGICARHGVPATTSKERKFYTRTPPWLLLLIPFSLLIAAIISLVLRKSVTGPLPACARCVSDRRRFVLTAVGGWVFSVVLLFVGGALASDALLWLDLLAFVAALVWSFTGDSHRVRGTLTKDQVWVELKGVSPAFARELQGGLQRAAGAAAQPAPVAAQPNAARTPTTYGVAKDILPGR